MAAMGVTGRLGFGLGLMFALMVAIGSAQLLRMTPRPPTRMLETPNFDRRGGSGALERKRDLSSLRQLLVRQLGNALEPLAVAPRHPGIVAPQTPQRSSTDESTESGESSESGESDETNDSDEQEPEAEPETEPEAEPESQPLEVGSEAEQSYNPFRDNFYDLNADGSYVFGTSLPNGVRRFERSYYSQEQKSRVVEGFYTQPNLFVHGQYELRCYRADAHGYHQFHVEYIQQPPRVRRDEMPNVNCFDH